LVHDAKSGERFLHRVASLPRQPAERRGRRQWLN
jgi:hypothetical protein